VGRRGAGGKPAPGKTIGLGMGVGFLLFMGTVTSAGYEWY
jgi:hypothetical protein